MAKTFLVCGHYCEGDRVHAEGFFECPHGCGQQEVDPSGLGMDVNQFIPDIPEHFNQSTNCVVKGRAHLRQMQREKGLSDYDPKEHSGPPTDWS